VPGLGAACRQRTDKEEKGKRTAIDRTTLSERGSALKRSRRFNGPRRNSVSGNVTLTFINAGPVDAVLSGLFIDPAATPTASASFVKTDATTQWTYTGVYGQDGYDTFDVLSELSAYDH